MDATLHLMLFSQVCDDRPKFALLTHLNTVTPLALPPPTPPIMHGLGFGTMQLREDNVSNLSL